MFPNHNVSVKVCRKKDYGLCFYIDYEQNKQEALKSEPRPPKKCFICFNGCPLKMMKNPFYFFLKCF